MVIWFCRYMYYDLLLRYYYCKTKHYPTHIQNVGLLHNHDKRVLPDDVGNHIHEAYDDSMVSCNVQVWHQDGVVEEVVVYVVEQLDAAILSYATNSGVSDLQRF